MPAGMSMTILLSGEYRTVNRLNKEKEFGHWIQASENREKNSNWSFVSF
jgi:hypothetical protein